MTTPDPNAPIGPFTKETFVPQKWKVITDKIYQLNTTNEEETLPYCREILKFLHELNEHPDYNAYFGDASIKNYFFREFFINNAKYLIATKNFINPEILELSNCCLEQMALFWIKALPEDHPKLTEMAKTVFDIDRQYFKINDLEEISYDYKVPSFDREPSEEHLEWIYGLKKGDLIDCLKIESKYTKMCWSHARVIDLSSYSIRASYLNEENLSKVFKKKPNGNEIAHYRSKCRDFEWRLSLKEGDELDACDTSQVWYNVTVLDTREVAIDAEKKAKEIQIGYRTYDEEGDRVDQEGKRFFGWSSKYDEWLNVTNPRLAKKNAMAKKLFMGSSSNTEDPVIDDSNDRIYFDEGRTIYAITRPNHCKSVFMVGMINKFGEAGGFDKILERIQNQVNWAPIETMSLMVTLLGNISSTLHREFAIEYIPKLQEAVWTNLLKSPDSNIRNFTKERIDNVLQAFDLLLKRIYSLPEKNEMIETLTLDICSICFDSNFLERKLQGLKSLLELLKNTKFGNAKFINNEVLNKFVSEHQIFDKIFGTKGHTQLIQRSSEFLKFMISEGNLSNTELEMVWNSTTKGDTETKLATYKVFSDIAVHLYTSHLEFLIQRISAIPPEEIIPEEIELVYELNRLSSKASGFTKKALGFYWNIIIDSSEQYTSEIADLTLSKFCDAMRGWDLKEDRIDAIYSCLENIQKGIAVLPSFKIMKKLIDQFPTNPSASDKFSKKTCVDHLCTEKNLLNILMRDLKAFKEGIRSKISDIKTVKEEDLDNLVSDRAPYLTSIGERLQFILFIFANNESETGETGLTYEMLSELWDVMVNEAFLPGERDVVYKWIKETAESKAGFPMNIDDLLKFFQEKFNNAQSFQNMTTEGFNCFKNLFLIINEKLGKITKISSGSGVTSYSPSYSSYGVSYHSYSYNYEENKALQGEFEYKVNTLPEELEGIQSIWNFILTAENENVAEKAIDFLNKLYLHVSCELEGKLVYMRSEYLATCFKHLKSLLENKEKLDKTVFTSGCLRCLSLVRSIMDESEKKGIGSLKSHSGLVKGELLTFNVNNDVTVGSDVPKKVELKLHSNLTVFELRHEVGKHFKATYDQVKLTRNSGQKEIKDNENGKTLGDIRIRNGETLVASKRPTQPIPQATLVMPDGSMNPAAQKIFVEWFNFFSEGGKMNPDQCAAFIHSCTNDYCKGEDKRVKEVFATYDNDHDGVLTLNNFLEFYYIACKQRPSVVWNNLSSHHYRNDLKKVTEVEEEKIDTTILSRYIISKNQEYFKEIFSLLDFGGLVATEAWKLLNRLPTSPEIFSDILMLKGVKDTSHKDWNHILDSTSTYKLLYALHVLEYLMEDENDNENNESAETEEGEKEENEPEKKQETEEEGFLWDPKLLEYKKNWRADFIACGGFDQLVRIFELFSRKDHSTLSMTDKNILSFLLKILKNYLTATFTASVPYIYRSLSFIKLYMPLDFIQEYIQTEQKKNELGDTTLEKQSSSHISATEPEGNLDIAKAKSHTKKDPKAEEKKKERLKIEESEEFKVLMERLKGDLGNQILSKLNLKDFIKTLVSLSYDLLEKNSPEMESEERMILEYSLSILIAVLLYDKSAIKYFLTLEKQPGSFQGADKFILDGIFCPKALNVRRYFSHAIYVLCKYTNDFDDASTSKHMINLFLTNLPSSDDESKKDCSHYFELLCKLIEETYASKQGSAETSSSFDFGNLIQKVIQRVKEHVSTEKRQKMYDADRIFIGLLNLLEKLIIVKPDLRDTIGAKEGYDMVKEIFEVCLFYMHEKEGQFNDVIGENDDNIFSKDYVKCKSRESRSIAYKLLVTLCRGHPANMLMLLDSLKDLMVTILKYKTNQPWNYSPSSDTRSYHGYAGIKNLGCICYMNAMLQQFFMTPTFRYSILAADDKKEPNLVNKDNKFTIDDNVLHQLQQMFGFLELTDRKDYNPFEFCFAFKDFTGQPVNVSEQQDTQEFLNTIFERLENGLKQTPFKHILEGVYGGKTSNQIICQGCRNVREKEELFYNMSVEVRNMKTVYDSFEQYITGETIEDFYCEACRSKNSITKRTCLSYLPNVLIVHLKRIVFDLDTLMNQKINSRLEFPSDLDMEPYTKEGLAWREKSKEKDAKKKQQKKQQAQGKDFEDEVREEKEKQKQKQKEKEEEKEKQKEKQKEKEKEKEKEEEDDEEGQKGEKKEAEAEEKEGPYQVHPKEYYQYRLAGVVVHIGTAEIGHYYSYININRYNAANATDKWLEFNDSLIKDFDIKNIEKECFGGHTADTTDDVWGLTKTGGRENSKNAYILVYERVTKDPLKFVVNEKEDESYLNKILNIDRVLRENPNAVKNVSEEVEDPKTSEKKIVESVHCDYFMLKRFIPAGIYKKVWEDNHKFMFERHIYSEDFFKFFKEVCNSLPLPVAGQNPVNFIYPDHVNFPVETKQNIKTLISILSMLIFYILSKSGDNNTILDLSLTLKNLLSLDPEAASAFFDTIVCKNLPSILELFINCPEKQVRHCTTQVILHSINVMISYYGFTLNVAEHQEKCNNLEGLAEEEVNKLKIEDAIIKFLRTLISYIPTEVAKNWTKFGQFYEFWRDFSISGEAQMNFLFQHEFIAILIDFYLEKKSPLIGYSEKKHSMGNRYVEPDFNGLLQTVAQMVQRANIPTQSGNVPFSSLSRQGFTTFQLTENDYKCLTCRDFYEKTLKDKHHPQALGVIIQQFAFENEMFSYSIADMILRGVNRTSFDDCKPYLEAMVYFLNIADFLQIKRIEWVLGFPQPTVTTALNSQDSFGVYGNTSIEDAVITYESPLNIEGSTSVINYMLQNRRRLENIALICLKQLLLLADINQSVFEYLLFLPPPSCNYAKFTDWVMPFLDYYFAEAKKYAYSSYPKEEIAKEALQLWKSLETKIENRISINEKLVPKQNEGENQGESAAGSETNTTATTPVKGEVASPLKEGSQESPILKGLFKTFLIGQTTKEEQIDKQVLSHPDDEEVALVTTEVACYITESKPTGRGNLTFPSNLVNDGKFKSEDVKQDSAESFFIKPKSSYPIFTTQNRVNNPPTDVENALRNKAGDNNSDHEEYHSPVQDDHRASMEMRPGNYYYEGSDTEVDESGQPNPDTGRGDAGYSPESAVSQELDKEKSNPDSDKRKDIEEKEEENPTEIQGMDIENKVQNEEGNVPEASNLTYTTESMLRRFVLYNNSNYIVNCQLRIFAKTNDFLNFRIPVSAFNFTVKPKSNGCILSLMKIFPQMGWGEYEAKCHIQLIEQPAVQKSDNDSGKKKNAGFNIQPIDFLRNGETDDTRGGMNDDDYFVEPY